MTEDETKAAFDTEIEAMRERHHAEVKALWDRQHAERRRLLDQFAAAYAQAQEAPVGEPDGRGVSDR